MAYRLPSFNLTCNIAGPENGFLLGAPNPPYRVPNQVCQLTFGRRANVMSTGGTAQAGVPLMSMSLLLPKGVDIRGPQDVNAADYVEVPAGSGRWYAVNFVDDIGKGFENEHRTASIHALERNWTPPYP